MHFNNNKVICGASLMIVFLLSACGGGAGGSATTDNYPVNEQLAAALVGKGIPGDIARFFAAAKVQASCPNDTTCTYLQTYPNGATREVTVTATPNQQYTPTADELAATALVNNPVYNWKFTSTGIADSVPTTDTKVDIGYFIPMTSIPAPMAKAASRRAVIHSATGVNNGVGISWTEFGKKGADVAIGSVIDHYQSLGKTVEATGNIYKVASLASDTSTAWSIEQQTEAWLAELDDLEKCAANPNQLAQTDPNYSANTVARLQEIRAEILANRAARFLNQADETAEGLVADGMTPGGKLVIGALSIPMKQGHEYAEQTLKAISEQYMQEARSSVVSCKPTCPTNLMATAVSESQINLSWTGPTDTSVLTGYNIAGGGANLTSLAATATSWSDTGLTASRTYCYVVSAYNEYGTSGSCPQACATTFGPPVIYIAPALLATKQMSP